MIDVITKSANYKLYKKKKSLFLSGLDPITDEHTVMADQVAIFLQIVFSGQQKPQYNYK